MANNKTIFQRLGGLFNGRDNLAPPMPVNVPSDTLLYQTTDKAAYDRELLQRKQEKLLSMQWVKAGLDNAQQHVGDLTKIKLMYHDADLMDGWPEIAAALDILSEEACTISSKGRMVNVYSKSDRIKSILDDLFINRLDIHIMLPMVCRAMAKYGNNFMLLNISTTEGVMGWRQLPVYEIDRIENGMPNAYSVGSTTTTGISQDTNFIWNGKNMSQPFKNWQIAHFRLLTDSFFLPYGVSYTHKARRAWRMCSMMEDAMLTYRLERSIERRVFKIFVGTIDDADIPAYINDIANNFKRTPIIDPLTGQIDLRKNFLDVSSDYFIPVRSESAPNPIETLPAANNNTSMDDIKYMHDKILSALRIPKTFLNFQEAQGKGQNLSLMDVRFSRMINRVQQALLMELNKIAIIHLYLLGFHDDLTSFTLSMNNPSSQIEAMELEALQTRVQIAQSALADPGTGIPLVSQHYVLREIMKFSDAEIKDIFNEIRLEKALAAELEKTSQIITRSHVFDPVDRIYGDPNAEYQAGEGEGGMGDEGGLGGGPMGGGPDFGGGLDDLGGPGGSEDDIMGESESVGMGDAPGADAGMPMESHKSKKPLLTENYSVLNGYVKDYINEYAEKISHDITNKDRKKEIVFERVDVLGKNLFINENLDKTISELNMFIDTEDENTEE